MTDAKPIHKTASRDGMDDADHADTAGDGDSAEAATPTPITIDPERLTKPATAIALVCFLAGWLVQGSYLYALGFSVGDLSILKAQLVVVGAVFLGSIALSVLSVVGAVQIIKTVAHSDREDLSTILSPVLVPILLAMPVLFFALVLGEFGNRTIPWKPVFVATALALAAGFVVLGCLRFLPELRSDSEWSAMLVVAAIFGIFYVFWYATFYASDIYPHIPQEFGGAKPVRVWIQVDDDATARALEQSGVPFGGDPDSDRRTDPLDLLYEDKDVLVVRVELGDVIRLERGSVVAVQVDNKPPRAKSLRSLEAGAQAGVPEEGDAFELRYSEPLDPDSILDGWDGEETEIVVVIERDVTLRSNSGGQEALHVLTLQTRDGSELATGAIKMYGSTEAASQRFAWGQTGKPSVITKNGASFEIVLGTASRRWDSGPLNNRPRWEPSTVARDPSGQTCRSFPVVPEISETRPPLF